MTDELTTRINDGIKTGEVQNFPGQRRAVLACPQPGGGLRAALAVPGVEVA